MHHPIITKKTSDGCAAQCKRYLNVINLCCHKIDFNFDADWTFFATNYEKLLCDEIGRVVKRLAANAGL